MKADRNAGRARRSLARSSRKKRGASTAWVALPRRSSAVRARLVPHRVADHEGAAEHGRRRRHAEDDREVGAPVVDEAARDERALPHQSGSRRPAASRRRSGKRSASAALWVTTTSTACARAWRSSSRSATFPAEAASRLPVGSSHRTRRGREHEGPGERRALPLPAGQLRRPVVEPVAEAHPVEELPRPRLVVALRPRDEGGDEDVLQHRALRQQEVVLEDEADRAVAEGGELGLRQRVGIEPVERDPARGRRLERAEDVEQRALAAARGAHDAQRLAGPLRERDVEQDRQRPPRRLVVLRKALDREHPGGQVLNRADREFKT